ncbi:hypothetical protein ILUMI_07201 [Ignelater luminosus]|uniref:Protein kinase domain-containing protein n=1 Tax=Ignelater luminosus TaxID=2038154 RepID=A0A8K0D4B7_IGNLU|nr:hypothetical protein ILUMI_07201 [Ignelater luminosus]
MKLCVEVKCQVLGFLKLKWSYWAIINYVKNKKIALTINQIREKKRCDTAVFESVAHPQGIMVWVGLSANGPTKPIVIEPKAKICFSYYVDKVLKPFLRDARRLYPSNDYIFHQDSAPAHRELHNENSDQVEVVAIKVLKESATREIEEDFFREVDIMSAFRHKNILSLLGVVLRESGLSPMMVFEYMPHGDLAELLRAQKKIMNSDDDLPQLTSKDLMLIAMQIASGMSYLAAQRFVHRDLACRNCLVASGPIVKIADFGMSRDVYTCDYYKIGGSRLLPVRWMSPESVMYGRFTLESDIWSYGIILWEIYSFGKQPYYGHSNEEVVKLILQGIMLIPPEDCPTLICDLMKSCWKTEPRDRIKFSEIYDKLEKAYKCCEPTETVQESCGTLKFAFENELKPNFGTMKKLPRPPPLLPQAPSIDLLDTDGYLLPKEIKEPVKYLDVKPVHD